MERVDIVWCHTCTNPPAFICILVTITRKNFYPKMFYFGGVVNGKYLKHEVKQLTLLLGRVKYRPLMWRNTHPYLVVDRHEDITHPSKIEEDEKCERSVAFYGYVRGTNLKEGMKVHLIGVGDYGMAEVSSLQDPCPVFDKEKDSQVSVVGLLLLLLLLCV